MLARAVKGKRIPSETAHLQIKRRSFRRRRRLPSNTLLQRGESRAERGGDIARNVLLSGENIEKLALIYFRPARPTGGRIDQLGRHPHAITGVANAAFHDRLHVELVRDFADRLTAVRIT